MPAHYALPIVVTKGRGELPPGSALNPLEPLDLTSSLRQAPAAITNSDGKQYQRRRKFSRDLGAWGKNATCSPHNLSCSNRPSPKCSTLAVLTKVARPSCSATIVYEPPSPLTTKQVTPRAVPVAKERLRQITLGQLIKAKRIVEASGVDGDEAVARSRAQTAATAAAVHIARRASSAVQDCVALMLEDFRLMEHQPAWRQAVAPLLPVRS